jgi:WD40 repeat protein
VLLAENRVVITDFGIAKLIGDAQLTMSGTIVGSPAYIAPEQVNGAASTPASDLYSLGATLYTAVEGRPPFEGPDVMATLAALLTRDPEPPVRAGRLTGLLTAMLRKDPAQRPTADQIAHVLAGGGGDEETFRAPAVMYPAGPPVTPSSSQPGGRGVRRRTMLLAGGGAVAAIGIGASVWYFGSRESGEQNGANTGSGSPQGPTDRQSDSADESGAAGPGNSAEPGRPVEFTDHIQLTGHEQGVSSLAFSPDGKLLASCDGDLSYEGPIALLWDAASGKQVATLVGPPGTGGASVDAVTFSPDGTLLAAGGNFLGDSTRLWNVADRKLIGPLADSHSIMNSLAFSPDGKIVAGVAHTGNITLWDVATRQIKIGIPDGDGSRNVVFSPDGKLLASGGPGGEVRLSEASNGRTVHTITDVTGADVSFSPDGKTLAVTDYDGTNSLRIWDVATGRSQAVFDRTEDVVLASVRFSPDGKTLAAWGLGNIIQLWDVASRRVRAVVLGAADKVNTVVFDRAGTRIACGAQDKIIRIWNLTS